MATKKNTGKPAPLKTGKTARIDFIKQIQSLRGTSMLSYVTNTRQNLEVHMALDMVRYAYDHLEAFAKAHKGSGKPKIDLFLHSNGGDGTMPWRLVTLMREYTDHLSVLVPHRAFSAATLTALGADEVVMHAMGMLGPTDATVANSFNPPDPANPQRKLGISVEDVTAYIQLIKEDAGIQHEDELIQAFQALAANVHPLALGNVKRSMSQSRMMARKLLELHMDHGQRHKIDEIVDNLTSKLFYHGHPINRTEAVEQIGLSTVKKADRKVEDAMWNLYLQYESEMRLLSPFDPAIEFYGKHDVSKMANGAIEMTAPDSNRYAYVESEFATDVSQDEYVLQGTKQANGSISVTLLYSKRGWVKE
jgi:hypothetical protein